jgi:hypothetical protein
MKPGWYEGQNDGHDEITARDEDAPDDAQPASFQSVTSEVIPIAPDTGSPLDHKPERYVEPPADEDDE